MCAEELNEWSLVKERERGKDVEEGREGGREGGREEPPTFLTVTLGPAYLFRPSVSGEPKRPREANSLPPSHPPPLPKAVVAFWDSTCKMGCTHTQTDRCRNEQPWGLQGAPSGAQYVGGGAKMARGHRHSSMWVGKWAPGVFWARSRRRIFSGPWLWWGHTQARQG